MGEFIVAAPYLPGLPIRQIFFEDQACLCRHKRLFGHALVRRRGAACRPSTRSGQHRGFFVFCGSRQAQPPQRAFVGLRGPSCAERQGPRWRGALVGSGALVAQELWSPPGAAAGPWSVRLWAGGGRAPHAVSMRVTDHVQRTMTRYLARHLGSPSSLNASGPVIEITVCYRKSALNALRGASTRFNGLWIVPDYVSTVAGTEKSPSVRKMR